MTGFEQIYWITRLDSIRTIFGLCMGFAIGILVIFIIGSVITFCEADEDEWKEWKSFWKKKVTASVIALIFGIIGNAFVPSKNDALLIMGGGTVLEYIENNEDLGKIPDNAVKALSLWSENFLEEQQKHEKAD